MTGRLAIVLTTIDDQAVARRIAGQLVEERLAACVQLESAPLQSIYRWEGVVESAQEWRVMIKLPSAGIERLRDRLLDLHPYDTPEFVVFDVDASEAYALWARDACS